MAPRLQPGIGMGASSAAPVPVLAFLTTIHAALVVLRRHRSAPLPHGYLFALPALAFAASPWVFPTVVGLAIGLAAQVAWFLACEKLAPVAAAPEVAPAARASRPASTRIDHNFVSLPVLAVHRETETITTFRLARPRHFSFAAGQFLTVRLEVDGRPMVRCYSISSAPESTGYLEISVRRHGLVSTTLHQTVVPGSTVAVKPPAGRFVYPADDPRPLVLIAGGVGITPLLSMLRHAVHADPTRRVTLLYSVRHEADMAFRDELRTLADRHPQLTLATTVTDAAASASCRVGRIDDSWLREMVPAPTAALYCICGPTGMMDVMRAHLARLGVPDDQMRAEVFQAATAIGAGGFVGERRASQDTRMTCSNSQRVVRVPAGMTLLEAAEGGGVSIPSMCRSGVCGTCRSRLVSGEVRCTSDALDEQDRADGFILPCVSWAESDCVVEA